MRIFRNYGKLLYNGKIDEDVDFERKDDFSGIEFKKFRWNGREMEVKEVIAYRPWRKGKKKPGSGQIGIYSLEDSEGRKRVALISDSKWENLKIFLLELEKDDKAMAKKLKNNKEYREIFEDYIAENLSD